MDLRIKFDDPEYYKNIRKKVKKPGGFHKMDKKLHLELSSKGGKRRWGKGEEESPSQS